MKQFPFAYVKVLISKVLKSIISYYKEPTMLFDENHKYLQLLVWENDIPSLKTEYPGSGLTMSYLKLITDRHDFVFINFLDDDGGQHNAFYYKTMNTYKFAGWDEEGAATLAMNTFEDLSEDDTELLLNVSHLFAANN